MAQKYGVYDLLKLSHKVEEARWDGAKWQVTVRDLATETVLVEEADYVPRLPQEHGRDVLEGHRKLT